MAKVLTSYFLESKLKKGWTSEDFARNLDIPEDKFYESLLKVSKNQTVIDDYRRRLETNKKKKRKKVKADNVSDIEIIEDETEEEIENESFDELENLQETEVSILNNIEELEASRIALITQKKLIEQRLSEWNPELEKLLRAIEDANQEIKKLESKIDGLNSEIEVQRKEHSDVENKIRELSKVTIFAYNDGQIEVSNGKTFSEEEWMEQFKKLVLENMVEELTIKQLKQLAKIITLHEALQNEANNIEIVCEDTYIQQTFEKIIVKAV